MVLMVVPDEPDDSQEGQGSAPPKAQLDDSEASRAARKVDLDLDDAPFLEDDEEEEEALDEVPEAPPSLEEKPPKEKKPLPPWLKNKFVLGGAGLAVVLAALLFFLLGGEDAPPEPEKPAEPPVEEVAPPAPEPEIPEEMQSDHLVKLDPFLVEQLDENGEIRFLEVSLVFVTPDEMLAASLVRLTPTVRYALFYYLRNKDLTFLTDENNSEELKKELLAVVNQYMPDGRFETVLFEEYLVK